jgi:conjugative transposon TraN protein
MKQLVCMICAGWIVVSSFAQSWNYQTVGLTTNKTTTLIFPCAVVRGDIGSSDVISREVKENPNILFLKARRADFPETNINVVTTDGRLYDFTVRYDSMLVRTVYNVDARQAANKKEILFGSGVMSPAAIENYAARALHGKTVTRGINDNIGDVFASIDAIYVKEHVIFFRLSLANASSITYDVDFMRFSLKDNRVSKRTATQQQELKPVCVAGDVTRVSAGQHAVAVYAFQKFTIPDKKSFLIEIGEKNGGRFLELRVKNSKLIKAALPDNNR